jgi:hypothetical protein
LLETLVASQCFLQGGYFVGGHVAGGVFAFVPDLNLIEGGRAGAAGLGAEFAPLHAVDGLHFVEDLSAALCD